MPLADDIVALAASLHGGGLAEPREIAATERQLGWMLPQGYREFVQLNDGAEGFVGDGYISFWRVAELVELNALARVAEFAPGLTAFATDGGTELFALDRQTQTPAFVMLPVVSLDWQYAEPLGDSFDAFLRTVAGGPLESRSSANPELFGRNAWQIHPVILGGHPTDPRNRTVLPLRKMLEAAGFWNDQIVKMRSPQP